jgi:hypothetical protein
MAAIQCLEQSPHRAVAVADLGYTAVLDLWIMELRAVVAEVLEEADPIPAMESILGLDNTAVAAQKVKDTQADQG